MDYLGKMHDLELNVGSFIHLENSWSLAIYLHGCIIHTQISITLPSSFTF